MLKIFSNNYDSLNHLKMQIERAEYSFSADLIVESRHQLYSH